MMDFLIYDAKVAVLIAVFYMFYRLMLARETFHRVNRLVLLLTAVASFVLPLCVITMHETVTMEPMSVMSLDDLTMDTPVAEPVVETPLWQILLPVIFMIGMLATLGHTLLSMFRILMLIKRSEKHPQPDGITICVSGNENVTPFSWMHYIVMNQSDYADQNTAILAHERGHIRLKHSWDLLLVDILTALQWFNPAMWMLRTDLRAIHEYEADGAVLSLGINARQYQYLLITKAASIGGYSLANGISHSTLKNRINMMLHKKSQTSHMLKLLALVPIVGVTLALNARTVTDYVYDEPQKQQPMKKGKANATIKTGMNSDIVVLATDAEPAEQTDGKTFKVYGVVKDKEDGSPIIGTIVQIANSNIGTVTDLNGEFAIDVQKGDALVASYVGYASDAIVVGDPTTKYVFELRKDDSDKVYDVAEEMPEFPGGPQALMNYLYESVCYPKSAFEANIQGRVIVQFVVDKDGTIRDAKVVRSVDPALDAEAQRVIYAMPKWNPGKQNGEAIAMKYTLPITFRLQGDEVDEKPELRVIRTDENAADPFIILDGNPITSEQMKKIDPSTIANMEILKDQPAFEKYGDKAKNGVVIITTKK
jgi:TonB family protein